MIQIKSTVFTIFFLSLCHIGVCTDMETTIHTIDSLKKQLDLSESYERFQILLELSELTRREDPKKAEFYMLEAKVYINERDIDKNLFDYYKHMASVKLSQNKYQESLELSEKAMKLQYNNLNNKDHTMVYETNGLAHFYLGENVKAQEVLLNGLRIADSLNLDTIKASIYNSIAVVYNAMNDSTNLEKYLLLAIDLAKQVNSQKVLSSAQGNLAILYTNQERYAEAEKLILETIQLAMTGSNKRIIGSNYYNLAAIYNAQQKHEKSLEYLKKGLAIAEQYQHPSSIAFGNLNIGIAYMELEQYDVAKVYIERGLQKAIELNHKRYHTYGLLCASELYERTGENKEALNYYKKYTQLNDSLLNKNRISAIAELEKKYEAEKKEKEILTLSNDKALAEKREKKLINTILLLCFGLLTFGSVFYFLRLNHVKNSIIQKKNLKIASDKIQLLEKGKEIVALESLIKGQETERERLAKEMHDGLGGLLAISHSKLTNLSTSGMKANSALKEASELIGDAYSQVRQISHNLMPLDLEKFGLVAALTNLIQTINDQHTVTVDFRTYNFDLFLNNQFGLNIYRITQEALANVLKSSKARNVLIELIQHDETISLTIEDDGIGFNLENKINGIGIRNMKNRTELLNGTFSIESKIAEGTSIFILFPLSSNELKPNQT